MKTKWTIDPSHSNVQFKIKHLVISTVTGHFSNYSGEVETDGENFESAKVHFSADVNSISTGQEQRDGHLKGVEFFDAANFPTIDFVSTSFTKTGDDTYKLKGDLTLHGTTKPVEFDVEFGGLMKDFYGNLKAGFEVSGKIKRKEFGLHWDGITEAGGVVVSDEVKLIASVQFAKVVVEEKVSA